MRTRILALTAAMLTCAIARMPGEALAAVAAHPDRIPAEAFGELPFFSDPDLSPDGRLVVARATANGITRLVVIDTQTNAKSAVALPEDLDLLWTEWAGNRILASFSFSQDVSGTKVARTRLMLFDPATKALTPLAKNLWRSIGADDIIHIDPGGGFILVSGQKDVFSYPSIWRIDLSSLKETEVVKPRTGVWRWFADSAGVIRAGLGLDQDRYWLLYRENADAHFRRVLKRRLTQDGVVRQIERYIPVVGSDRGYVIADTGSGRFALHRYDFQADTIGEVVFQHPQVDVDGFSYSRDTGDVAAVRYVDDRDRTLWLDPKMKDLQAKMDDALPGAINRVVSRSQRSNRMIVLSRASNEPGTYFLFDVDKLRMNSLAHPHAALDGKTLAEMQSVAYRARDGLQIPAYLTLPSGRAPKGLPLIVMPHGGPYVRDKWGYDAEVQFLANRGYAVLQPNFRGSTGYGKAFVEAARGEFGRKMQDDLDDGVRWLVSQGTVDPKRVCMMGASYGGYAAMWAAARNPEIYRCAISFAGISDVGAILRYDRGRFIAGRYYRNFRDRIRGDPDFNVSEISPLFAVERIKTPLLLAHGKDDKTVPVAQSAKLHDALTKAGKPHEYVVYEGEGHGFKKEANSVDFLKRVEAFLAKHNPADP